MVGTPVYQHRLFELILTPLRIRWTILAPQLFVPPRGSHRCMIGENYVSIDQKVSNRLWAFPKESLILNRHWLKVFQQPVVAFTQCVTTETGIFVSFSKKYNFPIYIY